jgi:hypothetical protein
MWHDANRNFIAGQRAWVGVDRPVTLESLAEGGIKYTVTIKNFGNSVALDIGLHAKAIIGWDKMKPAIEETCKQAADFSNVRRFKVVTNFGDFPQQISTGDLFPSDVSGHHFSDTIEKGTSESPLTVVGCIVYRDQFGKERRSRFCYQSTKEDATFPRLIYQCVVGPNDAD